VTIYEALLTSVSTLLTVDLSGLIEIKAEEIEEEFNIFQICIMNFVEAQLGTLTSTQQLFIYSGLSTFDFSLVTSTNFGEIFSGLTFDSTVSDSVLKLADEEEFGGISLLINVFVIFLGEGLSITELNGLSGGFDTYIVENGFWSMTTFGYSFMLALIESSGAEAAVIESAVKGCKTIE
jgi:hypothetical protein